MAWLITLCLFWAIGTVIANGIDSHHKHQFQTYQNVQKQGDLFVARTYVLAWQYYQQVESQVLQAIASEADLDLKYASIPCSGEMNRISKQIFGESIRHRAVREAWQKQSELGWPIYTLTAAQNPNASGTTWRLARAQNLNAEKEATILSDRIPNLGYFYSWQTADLVKNGVASNYIPQRGDIRTYQYLKPVKDGDEVEWVVAERIGTPPHYAPVEVPDVTVRSVQEYTIRPLDITVR